MERLRYLPNLTAKARQLRSSMTESEQLLWSKLRRRQIEGVQFYRQRPIGEYIVDFFAPKAGLIIEVDGSQHLFDSNQIRKDESRDAFFTEKGYKVLRIDNLEVLQETGSVLEWIFQIVRERLDQEIPPGPPLGKGGTSPHGDLGSAE
ncbi:MAG: DUF559 domain-containing protein [Desulfuromonadales bacterium]